jgi:hypothetical protein
LLADAFTGVFFFALVADAFTGVFFFSAGLLGGGATLLPLAGPLA